MVLIKNYNYSLCGEEDYVSMEIFITDLNDNEFCVATIGEIGIMTDAELDDLAQDVLYNLGYEFI